jgi:hypothetical protein
MIRFIELYLNAADTGQAGTPQYKYYAAMVSPHFDDYRKSREDVQAEDEAWAAKARSFDYTMNSDWQAVSGLGTNTVTFEGSFTVKKTLLNGQVQTPTIRNRITIRMGNSDSLLRLGPISLEITGIKSF